MTNRANSTQLRSAIYWHAYAAGDPASYSFGLSSSLQASGGIAAYSGADSSAPIDGWSSNASASTSTAWDTEPASSSHANDRAVVFAADRQSTTVTPTSGQTAQWSLATSGSTAGTRAQSSMSDKALGAAGSFTGSGTLGTASYWVGQVVTLTPKTSSIRYGYSGSDDSADVTMDTTNTPVDKTVELFGGVSRTVHYDSNGNATPTWQYPNLHGDILIQVNQNGAKTGGPYLYDPFGQPLTGSVDDLTGNFDYGWLGSKQRATEHEGNINIIEMGQRQYSPLLGRFLEVDPVEGGSANDYEYCNADPVNCMDLNGEFGFHSVTHFVEKHAVAIATAVVITGAVICVASVACGLAVAGVVGFDAIAVGTAGAVIASGVVSPGITGRAGAGTVGARFTGRGVGVGNFARVAIHGAHKKVPKGTSARKAAKLLKQHHYRNHAHVTFRGNRSSHSLGNK